MSTTLRYFLALLVLVFSIVQLTTAQHLLVQCSWWGCARVTFSKGWGPGKRAALYDNECRINAKSLVQMFHTLMVEIKHLLACDHQAGVNYLQTVEY